MNHFKTLNELHATLENYKESTNVWTGNGKLFTVSGIVETIGDKSNINWEHFIKISNIAHSDQEYTKLRETKFYSVSEHSERPGTIFETDIAGTAQFILDNWDNPSEAPEIKQDKLFCFVVALGAYLSDTLGISKAPTFIQDKN